MNKQEIGSAFARQIERFAADGYRFGATHQLRPGTQREAFDSLTEQTGADKQIQDGYFEIPTGVGKTALFISFIRNFLDATRQAEKKPRILIVVPTKKLVEQTALRFNQFMPDVAKLVEEGVEEGEEKIDYKHSDLGAYYSRLKYSDKPIVITTYQSLLRDGKKQENLRVFNPDEFGLAVFDEAHVLTGREFADTAKMFEDKAIRLAFTATPHYSEQKTLARYFPHRFYGITTAEAMRRNDLCSPRPVLVKTNYSVDRSKLETSVLSSGGREYNRRQLETMLNVAARNQAAIDTYLTYRDPDTKEPLFGQTGLVFCVGRHHASDVARQFNASVNDKPEDDEDTRQRKATIRRWLKENDITLAANIDGSMSISEQDRIFKLHEQGKILILCNVDLLKTGYDQVQDSFCMNLADTLSIVEAKQRNGRPWRIDPDNPDKLATNFDFVDEEVYQESRHNQQLLPIFCQEILTNDYKFRKPIGHRGMATRLTSVLPQQLLEQSDFEVITDYDHVQRITQERKEKREEAEVPELPDDKQHWVIGTRACNLLKTEASVVNQQKLSKALEALLTEGFVHVVNRESGKTSIEPTDQHIGLYRKTTHTGLYFDPAIAAQVAERMNMVPPLPEDKQHWVTGQTACGLLNIGRKPTNLKQLDETLKALLMGGSVCVVNQEHGKTSMEPADQYIGQYRRGSSVSLYFNPVIVAHVAKSMGLFPLLPKDKQHWVTRQPACGLLRIGESNIDRLNNTLAALLAEGTVRVVNQETGATSIEPSDQHIGQYRRGTASGGYYFDPAIAEHVAERMDLITPLPQDKQHWVTERSGCNLLRIEASDDNISKLNNILDALLTGGTVRVVDQETGATSTESADQHIGRYRRNQKKALYFDPAIAEHIAEYFRMLPILPEEKRHWVTGYAGCKLLNMGGNTKDTAQLDVALKALLEKGMVRVVNQDNGTISTAPANQHIGYYRRGQPSLYFDPAIAEAVMEEMGMALPLPDNKKHWVTGNAGCGVLRIQGTAANQEQLNQTLEIVLNEGEVQITDQTTGEGSMQRADQYIGKYRRGRAKEGLYYFDPAISDYLAERMGVIPLLPENRRHWVTGFSGCKLLKINASAENQAQLNQIVETLLATGTIQVGDAVQPASQFIERYRSKNYIPGLYFDPTIASTIRGLLSEQKAGQLKTSPIVPRTSPAKQTEEEREALKRGSQGR